MLTKNNINSLSITVDSKDDYLTEITVSDINQTIVSKDLKEFLFNTSSFHNGTNNHSPCKFVFYSNHELMIVLKKLSESMFSELTELIWQYLFDVPFVIVQIPCDEYL